MTVHSGRIGNLTPDPSHSPGCPVPSPNTQSTRDGEREIHGAACLPASHCVDLWTRDIISCGRAVEATGREGLVGCFDKLN
jgi:hypothetical protein